MTKHSQALCSTEQNPPLCLAGRCFFARSAGFEDGRPIRKTSASGSAADAVVNRIAFRPAEKPRVRRNILGSGRNHRGSFRTLEFIFETESAARVPKNRVNPLYKARNVKTPGLSPSGFCVNWLTTRFRYQGVLAPRAERVSNRSLCFDSHKCLMYKNLPIPRPFRSLKTESNPSRKEGLLVNESRALLC